MAILPRLIVFLGLSATLAQAQVGISPSLNASFLQELRARDADHAVEARDVLGDDRQALDRGRELSRPEIFKRFVADSDRMAADITGFNGPYQLGRKWFSPFYFGELAPSPFIQNKDGLTLGMAVEFQTEYNSAVNIGKGGVIFSPTLLWDGSYQISPEQRFTFSGGLGLNWISGNDQIDSEYWSDEFGVYLLPGTSLAYDVDLGALHLTAYDRVSARPYLGMLQNDFGLAATMDLTDRWSWTLNYTFSKTYDIDGEYGSYWRGSNFDLHTISTELVFKQSARLSLGLEGAWNWYLPENPVDSTIHPFFGPVFLPDDDTYEAQFMNVGLFAHWHPGQDFSIRLALGCQHYDTNAAQTERSLSWAQPQADDGSVYYSLALAQRLNEAWSHELSLGYERVLSLGGNYQLAHYANYGITGEVWQGGQFTGSLFIEYMDEPINITGLNFESTNVGIDLHLAQRLTSKLHLDLAYTTQRIYGDGNYGFNQQMGSLGFRYALDAKTQVKLGWQGFIAQFDEDDDDQHRLILSLRREF
jgi:hypothetical protein